MQLDQFNAANVKPLFDFVDQEPRNKRPVGRPLAHPAKEGETPHERRLRLRRERAAADRAEAAKVVDATPALSAVLKEMQDLDAQVVSARVFIEQARKRRLQLGRALQQATAAVMEQTSKQPL